jgi:toxin ParE1/3/4
MRIAWMKEATADLVEAYEYVYESNPAAADHQGLLIAEGVDKLAAFPAMGRADRIEGTRELVIAGTPYIVVYRIRARSILIMAVLHGAQRWPSSFKH